MNFVSLGNFKNSMSLKQYCIHAKNAVWREDMHSFLTLSQFCLVSFLSSPMKQNANSANKMKNGATVGRRDRAIKNTVSTGCLCKAGFYVAQKV